MILKYKITDRTLIQLTGQYTDHIQAHSRRRKSDDTQVQPTMPHRLPAFRMIPLALNVLSAYITSFLRLKLLRTLYGAYQISSQLLILRLSRPPGNILYEGLRISSFLCCTVGISKPKYVSRRNLLACRVP